MLIDVNRIICGDNVEALRGMPEGCIDLTVTSPPYDNLRTYNGFDWDFETLAKELYRVTKKGGVVVWVVGDETKDFCESLSSFKQAIYFVENCGFKLLDTMIYGKKNYAPAYPTMRRYAQVFEYMFVLSKGRPSTFNPVQVPKAESSIKKLKDGGKTKFRQRDGSFIEKTVTNTADTKAASNVWFLGTGKGVGHKDEIAYKHPATFPEKLAEDHILSWSNPDDIVLDPFIGSGTTAKMAALNNRKYIGIDVSEEYCELARRRVDEALAEKEAM